MRTLFICFAVVFMFSTADSQISINLGFNVESQPVWGPAGYDHVDYYYLPDIEVYYNVPEQRFYYYEGNVWISRSSLPYRYRHYDFYHSYKVVVNEREPYRNHRLYKEKYYSFRGNRTQLIIRDSRDSRYFRNKHHPEYKNWKQQQGREGRPEKKQSKDNSRERK